MAWRLRGSGASSSRPYSAIRGDRNRVLGIQQPISVSARASQQPISISDLSQNFLHRCHVLAVHEKRICVFSLEARNSAVPTLLWKDKLDT